MSTTALPEADISRAISRVLGLPSTIPGFSEVLARMQQSPLTRLADLEGSTFQSLVMQNGGAQLQEEAAKLREQDRRHHGDINSAAPPIPESLRWKFMDRVGWLYSSERGDTSGARFDKAADTSASGYYGTSAGMAEMRSFAIQKGVGWAANVPGILSQGPEAIKALADVHLREDSYRRLKEGVHLTDKDIVAGAHYFKKHGGDYNEAAKTMEEVQKGLNSWEQRQHQEAIHGLFNAKPHEEKGAREHFNKTMDGFRTNHPELKEHIEREKRQLHTQQKAEHAAATRADQKTEEATASLDAFNKVTPEKSGSGTHPDKAPTKSAGSGTPAEKAGVKTASSKPVSAKPAA